jgi:DNA-binding NarL/FixJ family response regulator
MRVILADDAVLIRQGVARLLADEGIDVVSRSVTPTRCGKSYATSRRTLL